MIQIRGLRKTYGNVVALDGLDLDVHEGEMFGLLGPNGAGKTTTIGVLTTRVKPTAGTAVVADCDVVAESVKARARIGVVPQRPNPDRGLTVRENLVFHATYFGIARAEASRRADALLDRLGIADKGDAKPDALSGGQQQRMMIARALTHEPRVLFFDEPTVGLDPQARLGLWKILRDLRTQGRTVVMTTHYMEEADQLCDRVAIVDRGKLLACDTPSALRAQAPGETIVEMTFDRDVAPDVPPIAGIARMEARGPLLRAYAASAASAIPALLAFAESQGHVVRDIQLARPSLETLFISLTGRKLA
ncbi:MAG TPA: ABC transporter ATP-binding protein [Thermoanaerobaculia bacterium]